MTALFKMHVERRIMKYPH